MACRRDLTPIRRCALAAAASGPAHLILPRLRAAPGGCKHAAREWPLAAVHRIQLIALPAAPPAPTLPASAFAGRRSSADKREGKRRSARRINLKRLTRQPGQGGFRQRFGGGPDDIMLPRPALPAVFGYFAWGCFRYFCVVGGCAGGTNAVKPQPSGYPSFASGFGLDCLPESVHYLFQLPQLSGAVRERPSFAGLISSQELAMTILGSWR